MTLGAEAVRVGHSDRDRAKSPPVNDIVLVEGTALERPTAPISCLAVDGPPTIEIAAEAVTSTAS